MGIKQRDVLSILLSVTLNLGIVYFLPKLEMAQVKNEVIKIGLVALEKEKSSSKETKLEVFKNKKSQKSEVKEVTTESIVENKEKVKREKNLDLTEISKSIKAPSFNAISKKKNHIRKKEDNLELAEMDFKRQMKFERNTNEGELKEESIFNDTNIVEKIVFDSKGADINVDLKKNLSFESIKVDDGKVEGLPSGYKLGLEDGEIVARWDSLNKEPVYPERAELKGLQGNVRVSIDINERGEVLNLIIIKGSGVPEINKAIENVGRTWKIYLSKHGLRIKGKVTLDYVFKLKGN